MIPVQTSCAFDSRGRVIQLNLIHIVELLFHSGGRSEMRYRKTRLHRYHHQHHHHWLFDKLEYTRYRNGWNVSSVRHWTQMSFFYQDCIFTLLSVHTH